MNHQHAVKLGASLLFWCVCTLSYGALNLADPIAVGPQVQKGQLANGLTYYIQKNTRPQKRLELRLVVRAGSVLEDDDQRGLAHFVEHMAFNGSTHFKKHELVSYLQSIGLKFGADLNAYTSFNETVYVLQVPTDKREDVEKAFLVLQDWAAGVSFQADDADQERIIVLEELRQGKGAQDRMNKVLLPKMLSGSQYAERLPIGTEESLKTFKLDAAKRFYADWYRPNLMAVVVVGDINQADGKALIESHFSQLKNPLPQRPHTYPVLPARTVSEAVVVTDKEATNNLAQILYPVFKDSVVVNIGDYRSKLVERLFAMMLGQRTQELTQRANPPFVGGGSAVEPVVTGFRMFSSSALLGRAGLEPALDALVQENQRVRQFGFGAAELERAKLNLLQSLTQAHAERDKTHSGVYAAEYIRNFLAQEIIPGIAAELTYTNELLPGITLADVNALAKSIIPVDSAKLAVYAGVQSADSVAPTQAQLLGVVEAAEKRVVVNKTEKLLPTQLMVTRPKVGNIVSERRSTSLGLVEWELSNGVKVILKPTNFQNDQILMDGQRFGGQSLYSQADRLNAGYAATVVGAMGLGDLSPLDLQKVLAGKSFNVTVGSELLTDRVTGSSNQADLEAMLQVVYQRFGQPRRDADLFQSFISRSQDAAKNAMARPEAVFSDVRAQTIYNNHPRLWLTPKPQDFASLDLDRLQAIYSERFGSAKDFTFVFVGSFTPEAIKPLVATYLASLPTPDLVTQFVDLGIRPVTGVVKKQVRLGSEPKAVVSLVFAGAADYSQDEVLRVRALTEVVNIKIIEVLRERLTLIYGGGLGGSLVRVPYASYNLALNLPCGPDNVDKVIAAALGEIQKIQESGPDAVDLAKVKANLLLSHRQALRENGYWLGELQSAVLLGTDPAKLLEFESDVAALTPAIVQAAAQKYLRQDNYVQTVLLPAAVPSVQ